MCDGLPQLDICEPDCSRVCSFPGRFYETCRCDPLCVLYTDCCSEASRKGCNSTSAENVARPPFVCQDSNSLTISDIDYQLIITPSFYWYWMVTVCPDDWVMTGDVIGQELRNTIENLCINTTQRLPPATDMNTGFDYRNEYCALCNRVNPDHIIRWEYDYECRPEYRDLIQNTDDYTLTEDDIERYCFLRRPKKPSFNLLSTGQPSPPERPCYPMRPPSCLDRDTLQNVTGVEWNETRYQTVKAGCFGTTQTPVTHFTVSFLLPFRNRDCATCNGFPENDLSCFSPHVMDGVIVPDPSLQPFSVLFDINNDGLILISSDVIETTLRVLCSTTEIYDPVLRSCRSIEFQDCIQRTSDGDTVALLVNGECVTANCNKQLMALNDTNSFSFLNSTTVKYESGIFAVEYTNTQGDPVICVDVSGGGTEVVVCNGSLISLNESDTFLYVDADSVIYGGEVYNVEFNNSRGEPVICVDFSNNGIILTNTTVEYYGYPIGFFVLTYIGCSLSVIGCILILITYSLFKELRTLPSKILMNLTVAILISNLLILLGGPVTGSFPDKVELCVTIAILLHYFFLSQFSWMSIMSLEMTRTFYQAYKLRVDESKRTKCIIFTVYFILGWSLPLVITVATTVVNFSTEGLVLYGVFEDGTLGSCWINHFESAIVVMVVPVAISLAFNTIMFAIVTLFLIQAYRSQSRMKKMSKSNISYFRLTVAVFTISGLSWSFGFIAILVETSWSWYPFIILNSIQGFVIFLAFLCTKKIGKLYLSLLKCRRSKTKPSVASIKQSVVGPQLSKIELKQYDIEGTTF